MVTSAQVVDCVKWTAAAYISLKGVDRTSVFAPDAESFLAAIQQGLQNTAGTDLTVRVTSYIANDLFSPLEIGAPPAPGGFMPNVTSSPPPDLGVLNTTSVPAQVRIRHSQAWVQTIPGNSIRYDVATLS